LNLHVAVHNGVLG